MTSCWKWGACLVLVMSFLAAPAATAAGDAVQPPAAQRVVQQMRAQQDAAYREALAGFDRAVLASPHEPAVATARCEFIDHFTDVDSSEWIQSAADDLDACSTALTARWPDAPIARVFAFEQMWGSDGRRVGDDLLAQADDWPPDLRRRLAARLSRLHGSDDNPGREGELALLAARLGDRERVPAAVLHLIDDHQQAAARELLRQSPPAEDMWSARRRVEAALALADPQAARLELARYKRDKWEVDATVAARAHLKAGDAGTATRLLAGHAGTGVGAHEVRFEVALAAGNPVAAAAEIVATDMGNFAAHAGRFAVLVAESPSTLRLPSMWAMSLVLLLMLAITALAPGLLLVPVHYRGLVRRARGRPAVPLFEGVGLGQAWIAGSVALCVPMLVAAVVAPQALAVILAGEDVPSASALRLTAFYGALAGLLVLAPFVFRLGRRHILGGRDVVHMWWRVLLAWGLLLLVGAVLSAWLAHGGGDNETLQTRMVQAMASSDSLSLHAVMGFAAVVVIGPVFEEVVFRGLLLGGMARHISFGWANLMQALVFAAVHGDPPRFVFYMAMGLLAGWLTRRSGALLPAIALHVLNNALAFGFLSLG